MPSYINTGVLGQYLGGTTLQASGLTVGQEFQQFAEEVKRKKRTLSAPSREEREALRQRRQERQQAAVQDVGAAVDTADVKVPEIKVAPEVREAIQSPTSTPAQRDTALAQEAASKAQNIASSKLAITKAPEVAKPPPAPPAKKIAPERQYGAADETFVRAFDAYYQNIQTKNASDVRSGAGTLQAQYADVVRAAQASGRQEYIQIAQAAGSGVAGQKQISARNVGQAKAASAAARSSIRSLVDLDAILKTPAAPAAPSPAPSAAKAVRSAGIISSRFFRR